jgi:hypothetical protein
MVQNVLIYNRNKLLWDDQVKRVKFLVQIFELPYFKNSIGVRLLWVVLFVCSFLSVWLNDTYFGSHLVFSRKLKKKGWLQLKQTHEHN